MSALPTAEHYRLFREYLRAKSGALYGYADFCAWVESERQRREDEAREREEDASDGASERADGWSAGRGAF